MCMRGIIKVSRASDLSGTTKILRAASPKYQLD